MKYFILYTAACVLLLGTVGCGTMKIPAYSGTPSASAQTREVQGLKVTVDPFTDRERAGTYFKVNPTGRRVYIAHVRAENAGSDTAWLLCEERMVLRGSWPGQELSAHGQNVEANLAAANAVGMAGAVALSIPMIFAGGKLTSDAMVVAKNFVDKEWRNQTLSPGQSAQGFVYFMLPEKKTINDVTALEMMLLNVRNQQTSTVSFSLNHETK
jgi:hypothetical protein